MGRYMSRRSSKAKKQRVAPSLDEESSSSVSSVSFLWMADSTSFPSSKREDSKSSDVDDADDSTGAVDSADAVIAGSHADDRSGGNDDGGEDRGGGGHTMRSLEVEVMALKLRLAEACTSDGRHSNEARTLAAERDGLLERVDDLTRERDAAFRGWRTCKERSIEYKQIVGHLRSHARESAKERAQLRVAAEAAQGECERLRAGMKRLRAENDQLKVKNEEMEDMVALLKEKAEALTRERDRLKVRMGGSCCADEMSASACSRSTAAHSVGSSLVGRLFQATGRAKDGLDGNLGGDDEESGDGEGENDIPDGLTCDYDRSQDPIVERWQGPNKLRSFEVEVQHASLMKSFLRSRVDVLSSMEADDHDSDSVDRCDNIGEECKKLKNDEERDASPQAPNTDDKVEMGNATDFLRGSSISKQKDCAPETATNGGHSTWSLFGKRINDKIESGGETSDNGSLAVEGPRQDDDNGTETEKEDAAALVQNKEQSSPWELFGKKTGDTNESPTIGDERQEDKETGQEDNVAPTWRLFGRRANAKETSCEKDGNQARDHIDAGKQDGANGNDESDAKNDCNRPGMVKDASSLSARLFHKRDDDKGNVKDEFIDSRPDEDKNVHQDRSFRGLGLFGWWSDRTLAGNKSVDADRNCSTARPNDASGMRDIFRTSKGVQEKAWKSDHHLPASSRPNPASQSLRNLFGKPTRRDDANVVASYENFAMGNDNGSAVSSVHAGRSMRDVFRSMKMIKSKSDPKLFTCEDSLSEYSDIVVRRAGTGRDARKNGGTNSSAEVWGKAVTWNQIQQEDAKHEPILRRRSVELCD